MNELIYCYSYIGIQLIQPSNFSKQTTKFIKDQIQTHIPGTYWYSTKLTFLSMFTFSGPSSTGIIAPFALLSTINRINPRYISIRAFLRRTVVWGTRSEICSYEGVWFTMLMGYLNHWVKKTSRINKWQSYHQLLLISRIRLHRQPGILLLLLLPMLVTKEIDKHVYIRIWYSEHTSFSFLATSKPNLHALSLTSPSIIGVITFTQRFNWHWSGWSVDTGLATGSHGEYWE